MPEPRYLMSNIQGILRCYPLLWLLDRRFLEARNQEKYSLLYTLVNTHQLSKADRPLHASHDNNQKGQSNRNAQPSIHVSMSSP